MAVIFCFVVALRPAAAAPPSCTVRVSAGDDLQSIVDATTAKPRPVVVCLGAGEFRVRRFLSLTRDQLVLRGEGPASVIRLDDGTPSPVVVIGDWEERVPRHPTANVTIEDLRIIAGGRDGSETLLDRPYLTNSAVVVRAGRDVVIRNVSATACRSACILTEHDTRRITIEHVDVGGAVWDGIAFNRTSRARVVGSTIHDNQAAGISTEHLEDSVIEDNAVSGNQTHGLYLSDSYRNTIRANRFTDNVLSGVFLTCAVREHEPAVRCWKDSMSAANVFERNRFTGNRVGYMAAANPSANCTHRGFEANLSRADVVAGGPREDPQATAFGRCLIYPPR